MKKESEINPVKLKCIMETNDGENWHFYHQFYARDQYMGKFIDQNLQGMRLTIVFKSERTKVGGGRHYERRAEEDKNHNLSESIKMDRSDFFPVRPDAPRYFS